MEEIRTSEERKEEIKTEEIKTEEIQPEETIKPEGKPGKKPKKTRKKLSDNKYVGPILVMLTAFIFICAGQELGTLLEMLMESTGNEAVAFAGGYLAFTGIWLLMLLLMLKKKNRPMYRAMGKEAKGNNWKTVLILGLLCGFVYNLSIGLMALANGDIKIYFNEFNPLYFLLLFVSIGIQSGAEELVCRVYVYQKLRKLWPNVPAVAIFGNALFFALLHVWNPGVTVWAILDIVVTGIMFSLMVYYFDSFWAPVLAHTTWNFTQNILLGLPNSGIVSAYSVFKLDAASATDSFFYTVNFGIEGAPMTILLGAVICIVLFLVGKKRGQKPLDVWNTENTQ